MNGSEKRTHILNTCKPEASKSQLIITYVLVLLTICYLFMHFWFTEDGLLGIHHHLHKNDKENVARISRVCSFFGVNLYTPCSSRVTRTFAYTRQSNAMSESIFLWIICLDFVIQLLLQSHAPIFNASAKDCTEIKIATVEATGQNIGTWKTF